MLSTDQKKDIIFRKIKTFLKILGNTRKVGVKSTLNLLIDRFCSMIKGRTVYVSIKKKKNNLSFVIMPTEHCNLKCKCCDNFSSIADERFYPVETLDRDFIKLNSLTKGCVDSIWLSGGEPLLHPEMLQILRKITDYFPQLKELYFITNGVLLNKQEAVFWRELSDLNCGIKITKYPVDIDFDSIEDKAKKHHVKLTYTNEVIKTMYKFALDPAGTEDINKSFSACHRGNKCVTLKSGRLYPCTLVPSVHILNQKFGLNFLVTEKDSIDIHYTDSIDEILSFLCQPIPFCRYCSNKDNIYNIPWGKTNKEIYEWII